MRAVLSIANGGWMLLDVLYAMPLAIGLIFNVSSCILFKPSPLEIDIELHLKTSFMVPYRGLPMGAVTVDVHSAL
jgi:hypothetical protein